MTTKLELEPRVTVLERGQEAIQRDLTMLAHSVKEQGLQLTAAISKLSVLYLFQSGFPLVLKNVKIILKMKE